VVAGYGGIKPGWCRLGFHFTMDDAEADFIIEAVEFVGEHGHRFLPVYRFDVASGAWTHVNAVDEAVHLSLDAALSAPRVGITARSASDRHARYREFLDEALHRANELAAAPARADVVLGGALANQFFPSAGEPGGSISAGVSSTTRNLDTQRRRRWLETSWLGRGRALSS
jgi:hypothetical protein